MLTLKENAEKLEEIMDRERELRYARDFYDGIKAVFSHIVQHRQADDFQRQTALIWSLSDNIVRRLDSPDDIKAEVIRIANILEDQLNKLYSFWHPAEEKK
jgi:hypothetical protein